MKRPTPPFMISNLHYTNNNDYNKSTFFAKQKRRENRKKLTPEHFIGCRGVKMFLLKYITISTVTTATVTTVTITTVTI